MASSPLHSSTTPPPVTIRRSRQKMGIKIKHAFIPLDATSVDVNMINIRRQT
jgi:hypothetical protein